MKFHITLCHIDLLVKKAQQKRDNQCLTTYSTELPPLIHRQVAPLATQSDMRRPSGSHLEQAVCQSPSKRGGRQGLSNVIWNFIRRNIFYFKIIFYFIHSILHYAIRICQTGGRLKPLKSLLGVKLTSKISPRRFRRSSVDHLGIPNHGVVINIYRVSVSLTLSVL